MTEFTIDFLQTQAGIAAAILVIVQCAKWIPRIKDNTAVIRIIAAITGVVVSVVWLPTLSVQSVFVAVFNGLVCALVAMKGYELGAPSITKVASKLWNAE